MFKEVKRTFANSLHNRVPVSGQGHDNFRKLYGFVTGHIIDKENPINGLKSKPETLRRFCLIS